MTTKDKIKNLKVGIKTRKRLIEMYERHNRKARREIRRLTCESLGPKGG